MSELAIIPEGALLLRNGIIEDIGPTRRVENLAGSQNARVIDAKGQVVMPSFVDADALLVIPDKIVKSGRPRSDGMSLKLTSRRKIMGRAAAQALDWARYGSLTVGAHTGAASDLPNVLKILRSHHELQSKPLRIRSIFSPAANAFGPVVETWIAKYLPAIKKRQLASVLELSLCGVDSRGELEVARQIAIAATPLGYAIRVRCPAGLNDATAEFASTAGAIAMMLPAGKLCAQFTGLSALGCMLVFRGSDPVSAAWEDNRSIREAIDQGGAVAIASGYETGVLSTYNMPLLIHLAVHRLRMTLEEAITATTWNAAFALRLSHVTGSLEPGKSGDVLILDIPDYHEIPRRAGHNDIQIAMRAGRVVYRRPGPGSDLPAGSAAADQGRLR